MCLKSTYFQYENFICEQKDGTTMGCPLSPVVANIFMEDFKSTAITTADRQPKVWYHHTSMPEIRCSDSLHLRPTLRNNLTHVKPKIKQEEKIDVVYKIPCECRGVYIGETGRTPKQRMEEHKRAVRKADPSNAIATHTGTTLHAIAWKESEAIDLESHWERKRIKEAIHIKKTSRTWNTDPGIILNPSWYTLLQRS